MEIKVLAFGIAKEIFGKPSIYVQLPDGAATAMLKSKLEVSYPRLTQLASYLVALNAEYAEDTDLIAESDEVAIIPPVSGG